jgi:hypothetical protein
MVTGKIVVRSREGDHFDIFAGGDEFVRESKRIRIVGCLSPYLTNNFSFNALFL